MKVRLKKACNCLYFWGRSWLFTHVPDVKLKEDTRGFMLTRVDTVLESQGEKGLCTSGQGKSGNLEKSQGIIWKNGQGENFED